LYDELGWARDRELFDVLSAAQAAQPDPLTIVTSTVGPVQSGILWELFELARAGDDMIRLIYHQENLSPKITEAYLEQQRAILPAQVFAREHLNTWGAGSEAFCTLEDWQRAKGDTDPRRGTDPGPTFAFLDLGWVHDESVLTVAKVEGDKTAIIAMETWQGSPDRPVDFGAIESRILELAKALNIRRLVIESPQGVMLSQSLNLAGLATETIHPTAKSQREIWGALYAALKNGSVHLPNDARLRRQLLTLTIKSGPTGWKVVDDPSVHQDRALACAGALTMTESKPEPYGEVFDPDPAIYTTPRTSIWGDSDDYQPLFQRGQRTTRRRPGNYNIGD
jgi:phage terminase large subunit-like protein